MHSKAVYALLSLPCCFVLQSSFFNFHTSIHALHTSMYVHLPSLYALHSTVLIFYLSFAIHSPENCKPHYYPFPLYALHSPLLDIHRKLYAFHPSLYALKLTLHIIITLFLAFHNTIVFLSIPYLYLRTPYPVLLTSPVPIRTIRFIINNFPTIHHPKHCTPYYCE